eukprot:1045907-Amphidinium_carterae.1
MENQSYVMHHYDSRNDADCASFISRRIHRRTAESIQKASSIHLPLDASRRGYMYDTNQTWVKLPARHLLHGVTEVIGARVSMLYYVPSFLYSLNVSLVHTLVQLGFSVQEWVKLHPGHFSELAKADPLSTKAVRGTADKEREKWKESINKELKGLLDRDTYEEVPASNVPLSQVQNAPARMVYVVKPVLQKDGCRYVKRKSRLVICGNFIQPYGETSTANLDVSVLRAVVTVGSTNGWSSHPRTYHNRRRPARHLQPPKICVDFVLFHLTHSGS